jgi:hypothetical protein
VRIRIVLTGLLIAALPAGAADLPEAAKARIVAGDVLKETRSVLEGALAGGAPAASALRVCAAVAQDLARKHEQEGWRVRRISEKYRNPADEPDADERAVLERWAKAHDAGALKPTDEYEEVITENGQRHYRYMKPIFIAGPVCLQCHGAPDKLAPGVREALQSLYPGDRATGYAVGDLRGAISVRIPLPADR